jgi:hypothetical protein
MAQAANRAPEFMQYENSYEWYTYCVLSTCTHSQFANMLFEESSGIFARIHSNCLVQT